MSSTRSAESDDFNVARGLTGIGVLADLYHISVEGESYDGIVAAGDRLGHVHVADADRSAPGEGAATDYAGFFQTLRRRDILAQSASRRAGRRLPGTSCAGADTHRPRDGASPGARLRAPSMGGIRALARIFE